MNKAGLPILAIITAIAFLGMAVVLILFSNDKAQPSTLTIIGLIVSTIPSLVAAAFSERASRDIRNGTVVTKAKEGAVLALRETGVTDVVDMSQRGETSIVVMKALAKLLEQNTQTTATNTQALNDDIGRHEDRGDNGRQSL